MSIRPAALLGLLLSLAGTLFAQKNPVSTPEDRFFELPHYSIRRAVHIDLGKGDYLELELVDQTQLPRFRNLDSLLLVFLTDIKPFKDSLADPLSGKRIDYLIDTAGRKILRIRETRSPGTTFLLGDADPSLLRLRQDTVYILLAEKKDRFNRLTLVCNRYSDLENWIATGLNAKMQELAVTGNNTWAGDWKATPRHPAYMVKDPSITAKDDSIYSALHNHDYLVLDGAIFALQNYKNYLTPSIDLGVTIDLQRHDRRHEFGVYWEPLFLFGNDTHGRLQTYRNDLLVFRYAYDIRNQKGPDLTALVGLNTNITLGYVIHRSGDYFEKSSFRLTAGEIRLRGNKIILQPCIYFNNIFKDVTPGLRLVYRVF